MNRERREGRRKIPKGKNVIESTEKGSKICQRTQNQSENDYGKTKKSREGNDGNKNRRKREINKYAKRKLKINRIRSKG